MSINPSVMDAFKYKPWHPNVDPVFAINKMRELASKPIAKEELLAKAFVQPTTATTGLAQYDLEEGARLLYPITTPLRNVIPRSTGGMGIQANWRAVTAVNPLNVNIGLGEGQRGGVMSQTVVEKYAAFKTSGLDNYVTEQAYFSALGFEDLNALAATTALQSTMEQEEKIDLGGNSSLALGKTGTPAGTGGTSGYMSDGTYYVYCVALTYLGMVNSTKPTGQGTSSVAGGAVALPYTRSNLDGTTTPVQGFCGQVSDASSGIVLNGGGTNQSIAATVTPTVGALGYAWYCGTSGNEKLVAVTGYPSVTIVKTNSTGQAVSALPATDTSTFALNYDGILTQIMAPGSGSYVKDIGGAPLTSAGAGSGQCAEINAAIESFFAEHRLIPTDIWMSAVDQQALSAIVLNGNTNLAPFFMGGSSEGGLQAGTVVKRYVNPIGFGTPYLDVHVHPFLPAGTIMFWSRSNPYPLSNVPTLVLKRCRRDYWQVDWPQVTLQRTIGVYFDGVLQCYFPPAFGVITGVKS